MVGDDAERQRADPFEARECPSRSLPPSFFSSKKLPSATSASMTVAMGVEGLVLVGGQESSMRLASARARASSARRASSSRRRAGQVRQ